MAGLWWDPCFRYDFLLPMCSWARKGAGGKTHSGTGTVLEPCWNHSGTVLEPPTILLEPGFSDGLALCVFEHSACPGPRPTMSLYNTKREI